MDLPISKEKTAQRFPGGVPDPEGEIHKGEFKMQTTHLAFLLASARSIFTATRTGWLALTSRAKSLSLNFSIPSTSQR